jgi:hypothetical protein
MDLDDQINTSQGCHKNNANDLHKKMVNLSKIVKYYEKKNTVDFLQVDLSTSINEHLNGEFVTSGHGQVEGRPVRRVHGVDPRPSVQQNLCNGGQTSCACGVQGAAFVRAPRLGVGAPRQQEGHCPRVAARGGQQQWFHLVVVAHVRLATWNNKLKLF